MNPRHKEPASRFPLHEGYSTGGSGFLAVALHVLNLVRQWFEHRSAPPSSSRGHADRQAVLDLRHANVLPDDARGRVPGSGSPVLDSLAVRLRVPAYGIFLFVSYIV